MYQNESEPNRQFQATVNGELFADKIKIPEKRLREINQKVVNELAESISTRGLQINPITCLSDHKTEKLTLIAGLHRLLACKQLGIPVKYRAFNTTMSPGQQELIELEENLVRHDLTAKQKSAFAARKQELINLTGANGPNAIGANGPSTNEPTKGPDKAWFRHFWEDGKIPKKTAQNDWKRYQEATGEKRSPTKAPDAEAAFLQWLQDDSTKAEEAGRQQAAKAEEIRKADSFAAIMDAIAHHTDLFSFTKEQKAEIRKVIA